MVGSTASARRREVQRLAAVLDHADAALTTLLPSDSGESAGRDFFTRTKLASETALLLYAAYRADPALVDRVRDIAARLRKSARSPELLAWARLRPQLIPELSVAHWVLSALGDADSGVDMALRDAAGSCSVAPVERLPWKQVERFWQVDLGAPDGGRPPSPDAGTTALGERQDALFATREEVYGLTHALIYLTDFGHRSAPLPRSVDEISADAGSALARCLDDDDFDLAAEVLMTWPYARTSWSPEAAFGLHVLRSVDTELGFLPSMTLRSEEYDSLPPEKRSNYYYREAYHTVYVMGLLTSATLASGVDTAAKLVGYPEGAAWSARLLDQTPQSANTPLWEGIFRTLTASEQGALTPLLADVAIRRTVKAADYARLPSLLQTALQASIALGWAPTPILVQGVELMHRLAGAVTPVPEAIPMATCSVRRSASETRRVPSQDVGTSSQVLLSGASVRS